MARHFGVRERVPSIGVQPGKVRRMDRLEVAQQEQTVAVEPSLKVLPRRFNLQARLSALIKYQRKAAISATSAMIQTQSRPVALGSAPCASAGTTERSRIAITLIRERNDEARIVSSFTE